MVESQEPWRLPVKAQGATVVIQGGAYNGMFNVYHINSFPEAYKTAIRVYQKMTGR